MNLYKHLGSLTPFEVDTLKLMAHALSSREIAQRQGVSVRTVRCRESAIFSKLGVRNRMQAALYAWRNGYVDWREAWRTVEEKQWDTP